MNSSAEEKLSDSLKNSASLSRSAIVDVNTKGAFVRKRSTYRDAISAGGAYPPASGRYLLYVSLACPWASRCLALVQAKGLQRAIQVVVASPIWVRTKPEVDQHEGWGFDPAYPGGTTDPIFGAKTIREVYERALPEGQEAPERFTVPFLFDSETRRVVNNESSEIIRFLNSEFNAFAEKPQVDLYPEKFRGEIDAMNTSIYESVNNGVYKCGFAQSQEAYLEAINVLYERLDDLEDLLGHQRYLIGGGAGITEADIRLFVTLVRFDPVYAVHFKCSGKRIREYPNLHGWLRDVYQNASLAPTVDMRHIKDHYYLSHKHLNPFGIVPIGDAGDLDAPHGREGRKL